MMIIPGFPGEPGLPLSPVAPGDPANPWFPVGPVGPGEPKSWREATLSDINPVASISYKNRYARWRVYSCKSLMI